MNIEKEESKPNGEENDKAPSQQFASSQARQDGVGSVPRPGVIGADTLKSMMSIREEHLEKTERDVVRQLEKDRTLKGSRIG